MIQYTAVSSKLSESRKQDFVNIVCSRKHLQVLSLSSQHQINKLYQSVTTQEMIT